MNEQKNVLIGKTLTGLKLAEDRGALLFITTEEEVLVEVDADCCSYTWIEHIELPALGFPCEVLEVEDLDMPEGAVSEFHTDADYLHFYGCKITTSRGEILIDYRNDSNGYYGGSLSWPGDYHYDGVYGQNKSKFNWKDVA